MDSASASTTPKQSHDDDTKWALLLEYDAADFRGRHELLDREQITVRDIARWRRETAKHRAANNAPPARKTAARKAAAEDSTGPAAKASDDPATEGKPGITRPRRRSTPKEAPVPAQPSGHLSALRGDVVAAHASALVYHADALSRLMADAGPGTSGYRRRHNPIDRLTTAAMETSAAAREVLSARRRSGVTDAPLRDSVDVASELTDMLSTLTDYSSLAVAVQLLARELTPTEGDQPSSPRRPQGGDRNRRPWWGAEDAAAPTESPAGRQRHRWGGNREQND